MGNAMRTQKMLQPSMLAKLFSHSTTRLNCVCLNAINIMQRCLALMAVFTGVDNCVWLCLVTLLLVRGRSPEWCCVLRAWMIKCIQSCKSDNRLRSQATSEGEVIESNFQISRLIHYQGGKTTQTKIFGNLYMFIIIQIQASESVLAVILALFSFCRVRIHTVEYQIPRVELGVLKVGGGNLLHRNVVLCIFKCQSICMWISSNNSSSRNFCKTTKSKNKWPVLTCGNRTFCCA
jgi:hypothetical protein